MRPAPPFPQVEVPYDFGFGLGCEVCLPGVGEGRAGPRLLPGSFFLISPPPVSGLGAGLVGFGVGLDGRFSEKNIELKVCLLLR